MHVTRIHEFAFDVTLFMLEFVMTLSKPIDNFAGRNDKHLVIRFAES